MVERIIIVYCATRGKKCIFFYTRRSENEFVKIQKKKMFRRN